MAEDMDRSRPFITRKGEYVAVKPAPTVAPPPPRRSRVEFKSEPLQPAPRIPDYVPPTLDDLAWQQFGGGGSTLSKRWLVEHGFPADWQPKER